ncbi:choice-of-anchor R domain-containing protein [Microcystis aeruginosa]|uniref:choice-of-anchor R domain-containing protein n=1 Tax=Microcystis aeruginosa TaxID=1126 RepID=UPI0018822BD1|nr:choice-of-anchor R domain-containing protein [Microcystis aeruginosa]MBE8994624.1 PEP-CTERM sorting domain-containing protein [Microcystis aeruginosa LEGE 91341]
MTKNQQILAKMGGSSLALLLSLSLGQQASAATLVENLPPTTSSSSGGEVKFDQWVRSSFTTGSGSYGYTLNSVTLRFAQSLPVTPTDNLFVRLYSDNAGALGTPITSFTNPSPITTTTANNIFTLTTPQTLGANTAYWLVAGVSSGSEQYIWALTDSGDQIGELGWSIGDSALFSGNQGGTWNPFTGFNAFQFSVDGTVNTSPPPPTNIPEPGSVVALLGLGGLGLASRLKKLSTRA